MAAQQAAVQTQLDDLLAILACPSCHGTLAEDAQSVVCQTCKTPFAIENDVLLLAVEGTAETWTSGASTLSSRAYQQKYVDSNSAAQYNRDYKENLTKRWSTQREFRLIHRLLSSQPRCTRLLNLPCGGGRLSSPLAPHTDLLIEADIGLGQVLHAKRQASDDLAQVWITASAFHIPLKDAGVDGVFCARLCHHLPTPDERERLLQELLRVSRRFVVMSFFDYHSVKNTVRRLRQPFDHKPPKMTMTIERVAELAELNGATLVSWPQLSFLGSGHRYALLEKK